MSGTSPKESCSQTDNMSGATGPQLGLGTFQQDAAQGGTAAALGFRLRTRLQLGLERDLGGWAHAAAKKAAPDKVGVVTAVCLTLHQEASQHWTNYSCFPGAIVTPM